MNTNKLSLVDFYKKYTGTVKEIYDESSLDEDGNIIPFDMQAAIITHYLMHKDFAE